jgi:cell wall-associated NlpC family hydrolase
LFHLRFAAILPDGLKGCQSRADNHGVQFRRILGILRALAIAGVASAAVLTGACASSGATPHPFPMPGAAAPGTPEARASSALAATLLQPDTYAITGTALSLRGAPYRNGGADPSGFDCSGFTQYVFAQYGVTLPRAVVEQFKAGKAVRPDELAAGDLVFFTTTSPGASHVAIALGGNEFIHAPSSSGVVRVERLSSGYWSQRFIGARRLD